MDFKIYTYKLKKIYIFILFLSIVLLLNPSFNTLAQEKSYDTQGGPYASDGWFSNVTLATIGECEALSGKSYDNRCKAQWFARAPNGTMILTIEAINSGSNPCDQFLLRSYDNGSSWNDLEFWYEGHENNGTGACSAHLAVDYVTQRIWCGVYIGTAERRQLYVIYSDDNGSNWEGLNQANHRVTNESPDILEQLGWYANPPGDGVRYGFTGNGIVIRNETHTRVAFCNYRTVDDNNKDVNMIYTDDPENGLNSHWNETAYGTTGDEYSEFAVVELTNNSVYATIRDGGSQNIGGWNNRRFFSYAPYPMGNFTYVWNQTGNIYCRYDYLNDPESKGDTGRLTTTDNYQKDRILLAWNNKTFDGAAGTSRRDLTIGISYDEGTSFNVTKMFYADGYYPCIGVMENKSIIVAYTDWNAPLTASAKQFNVEWVSNGYDALFDAEPEAAPQFISIENSSNGTTISTSQPTFNWTKINNAGFYQLQIDNNIDFSSPEVNISNINEFEYPSEYWSNTTNVSFILPNENKLTSFGTFYCRVRAQTK